MIRGEAGMRAMNARRIKARTRPYSVVFGERRKQQCLDKWITMVD